MPRPLRRTCKDCAFAENTEINLWVCQRYPPQVDKPPVEVEFDDWCGEYKPANRREDANS